jgi:hypothetical protein
MLSNRDALCPPKWIEPTRRPPRDPANPKNLGPACTNRRDYCPWSRNRPIDNRGRRRRNIPHPLCVGNYPPILNFLPAVIKKMPAITSGHFSTTKLSRILQ